MDNLKNKTGFIKIELNDKGDYTTISVKNTTVFEKYMTALNFIANEAEKMPKKIAEIKKRYKGIEGTVEKCRAEVEFSNNMINILDGVFGEGTIRKYFRDCYEQTPDFLPDADCFGDFLEKMTPVMESLFAYKFEGRKKNLLRLLQKLR